jgi:hypothetical protein
LERTDPSARMMDEAEEILSRASTVVELDPEKIVDGSFKEELEAMPQQAQRAENELDQIWEEINDFESRSTDFINSHQRELEDWSKDLDNLSFKEDWLKFCLVKLGKCDLEAVKKGIQELKQGINSTREILLAVSQAAETFKLEENANNCKALKRELNNLEKA